MCTQLKINAYLTSIEDVIATFKCLTTRISIMLSLEGANLGGLENTNAASILKGAADNRVVLARIRETTFDIAGEMDLAGIEKLEKLIDRVAEMETGLVEEEAALRERVKSYERRRSDTHIVSF